MTAHPMIQSQAVPTVKLLIDGEFVESRASEWRDVIDPATQQVLAHVPFATADEVSAAVAAAKRAFKLRATKAMRHRTHHRPCRRQRVAA